ncbi:hypothetical protein TNIN_359621 [Trichonephila inaurata madagascariensis]|uniref:Uncharacterized protein n=1 Tax=Trichonephila inaurata madagascariensis TaxID=2747483 RepID=A0A8X6YSN3_9ARAC|nr:hypothetical protein TNIN_359621 [Trichonephila inaurata madagascariensis]
MDLFQLVKLNFQGRVAIELPLLSQTILFSDQSGGKRDEGSLVFDDGGLGDAALIDGGMDLSVRFNCGVNVLIIIDAGNARNGGVENELVLIPVRERSAVVGVTEVEVNVKSTGLWSLDTSNMDSAVMLLRPEEMAKSMMEGLSFPRCGILVGRDKSNPRSEAISMNLSALDLFDLLILRNFFYVGVLEHFECSKIAISAAGSLWEGFLWEERRLRLVNRAWLETSGYKQ